MPYRTVPICMKSVTVLSKRLRVRVESIYYMSINIFFTS